MKDSFYVGVEREDSNFATKSIEKSNFITSIIDGITIATYVCKKNKNIISLYMTVDVSSSPASGKAIMSFSYKPLKYHITSFYANKSPYLPDKETTLWLSQTGELLLYGNLNVGSYVISMEYNMA